MTPKELLKECLLAIDCLNSNDVFGFCVGGFRCERCKLRHKIVEYLGACVKS